MLFGPFHRLANPWQSGAVKVPKRAMGRTWRQELRARRGKGRTACVPGFGHNSELSKGCLTLKHDTAYSLLFTCDDGTPCVNNAWHKSAPQVWLHKFRGQHASSACSGRNDSLTPCFLQGIHEDWGQGSMWVGGQENVVVCHQCVLTAVSLSSGGGGLVVPELPLREVRSKQHPARNTLEEDTPISKPLRQRDP